MILPSLDNHSDDFPTIETDEKDLDQIPLSEFFEECPFDEDYYGTDFTITGWTGMFNLDMTLSEAIRVGASDVHLTADQEVAFTILGDIVKRPDFVIPDREIMSDVIAGILNYEQQGVYVKDLDFDCSYEIRLGPYKGRRTRVNIGKSFNSDYAVFRIINDRIPSLDELTVEQPLRDWIHLPSGVIILGASTGQGKSTTLASMIRSLQLTTPKKIITIERPIEYIYPTDGKGLVTQRAVGDDVLSFYNGLTAAVRQNPDCILIGEVRNTEEVSELIRAAETGHLALSTMHTSSVPTTVNRILSLFTGDEQRRIKATLGDTLRGLCNQVLVKRVDGKSRFAVREILEINNFVRHLILTGDILGLRQYMFDNGLTMEQALFREVQNGNITIEEARSKAPDLEVFNTVASGQIMRFI